MLTYLPLKMFTFAHGRSYFITTQAHMLYDIVPNFKHIRRFIMQLVLVISMRTQPWQTFVFKSRTFNCESKTFQKKRKYIKRIKVDEKYDKLYKTFDSIRKMQHKNLVYYFIFYYFFSSGDPLRNTLLFGLFVVIILKR